MIKDGQIPALRVVLTDIAERKLAEEALDRFFEEPLNLHLIAGLDGVIHRVNKGWKVILGYGPEELVGSGFIDLVQPDGKAAMGGDAGVVSQEGRGSTFWVTVRLKPAKASGVGI